MNAKPLLPLPKQTNEALKPIQLLMPCLILAFGLALGILAFFVELSVGSKNKIRTGGRSWAKKVKPQASGGPGGVPGGVPGGPKW